jgi:hypothetical protein
MIYEMDSFKVAVPTRLAVPDAHNKTMIDRPLGHFMALIRGCLQFAQR